MLSKILFVLIDKLLNIKLVIRVFTTLSKLYLNNTIFFILLKVFSKIVICLIILNSIIKTNWHAILYWLK
jgi:hypothetical protein